MTREKASQAFDEWFETGQRNREMKHILGGYITESSNGCTTHNISTCGGSCTPTGTDPSRSAAKGECKIADVIMSETVQMCVCIVSQPD